MSHFLLPDLALREYVRGLEPEYSLLFRWRHRTGQWREELRAELEELMGLPKERCPLDVQELESASGPGFTRIRLAYNVEEGVSARAWLCVPHDNETPLPGVVCAHPRGAHKDHLVGLAGDPARRPELAYASALAGRGFVTLAPDARGFGERGDGEAGVEAVGRLLGRPLIGMAAWDLSRAVDVLVSRPDVQPDRIGLMGVGMGAIHGLFAAALDQRVSCTAVCGGLTTYRELVVASDCFRGTAVPPDLPAGLLKLADLDDVACLIAPRPLMLAQAEGDWSVPLSGARELLNRTRAGYELLGEQGKLEAVVTDGGAERYSELVVGFLEDWLKLGARR